MCRSSGRWTRGTGGPHKPRHRGTCTALRCLAASRRKEQDHRGRRRSPHRGRRRTARERATRFSSSACASGQHSSRQRRRSRIYWPCWRRAATEMSGLAQNHGPKTGEVAKPAVLAFPLPDIPGMPARNCGIIGGFRFHATAVDRQVAGSSPAAEATPRRKWENSPGWGRQRRAIGRHHLNDGLRTRDHLHVRSVDDDLLNQEPQVVFG